MRNSIWTSIYISSSDLLPNLFFVKSLFTLDKKGKRKFKQKINTHQDGMPTSYPSLPLYLIVLHTQFYWSLVKTRTHPSCKFMHLLNLTTYSLILILCLIYPQVHNKSQYSTQPLGCRCPSLLADHEHQADYRTLGFTYYKSPRLLLLTFPLFLILVFYFFRAILKLLGQNIKKGGT